VKTYVVCKHVQAGNSHNNFPSLSGAWFLVVHDSDDQLEDTTGDEAGCEDDSAATIVDYNEGVDDQSSQTDSTEDTAHGEWVTDVSHGEEVCFISCYIVSKLSILLIEETHRSQTLSRKLPARLDHISQSWSCVDRLDWRRYHGFLRRC